MAATTLLDGELSADAVRQHTAHFAAPRTVESAHTESIVVFRIGPEWLALPMSIVLEVAETRPIRTLPHRRGGLVLGVANVRGELLVCVSLPRLLGLDRAMAPPDDAGIAASRRLLVLRSDDVRVVAPVDEIAGIHRFTARDVKDVPTIVARASVAHSRAVLTWSGHSIGLLDGPRMMRAVRGNLS
jgi:chemotaxis-related protein WspD